MAEAEDLAARRLEQVRAAIDPHLLALMDSDKERALQALAEAEADEDLTSEEMEALWEKATPVEIVTERPER